LAGLECVCWAGLRGELGYGAENWAPPQSVGSIGDLIEGLKGRSPGHAEAFADISCIRAAVNQEFVDLDTAIPSGAEIAFFPPVTGG